MGKINEMPFSITNIYYQQQKSGPDDIPGSRSPLGILNFKSNPVAFQKRFKTGHTDRRIMDKHVLAFVHRDKPKPLFFIKPFYNSVCQSYLLLHSHFFCLTGSLVL